jgi:hypothetical protein
VKLSVMSWDVQSRMEVCLNKVVEAYGFPKEAKTLNRRLCPSPIVISDFQCAHGDVSG